MMVRTAHPTNTNANKDIAHAGLPPNIHSWRILFLHAGYTSTQALFNNFENRLFLRQAMEEVMQKYPFTIIALVVLPDHLHCVITLPETDMDYSKRWSMIKRKFSKAVQVDTKISHEGSRKRRRELWLWQRRFWEHIIRDERDYTNHIHYCYWNPVKHGYVQRVADWPHSTFHRDVKAGILPLDWGGNDVAVFDTMQCGE